MKIAIAAESSKLVSLFDLPHQLGREDRKLAILGKGNTSARLTPDNFAVKASGSNLATLSETGLSECRFETLIPLLSEQSMTDTAIYGVLFSARVSTEMKKPAVEAIFHAYLLTLPSVNFVGLTHPIAVNAILCSAHACSFAKNRLFPDEIVCCGVTPNPDLNSPKPFMQPSRNSLAA